MIEENPLSDLIGSRICHDLISPLGAIGNGVELLSLSSSGVVPELALISESIENANARIRYFRVAYGSASPGAEIANSELRSILHDMYKGGRLRIEWRPIEDLPRSEVKLAFLVIQCLETCLPWGGTITTSRTRDGNWRVTGKGERLKFETSLWDLATNNHSATQVTASEVQFALVHASADRAHRSIAVRPCERGIEVSF